MTVSNREWNKFEIAFTEYLWNIFSYDEFLPLSPQSILLQQQKYRRDKQFRGKAILIKVYVFRLKVTFHRTNRTEN